MQVIADVARAEELSPIELLRRAVRLYHALHLGACSLEWKAEILGDQALLDEITNLK